MGTQRAPRGDARVVRVRHPAPILAPFLALLLTPVGLAQHEGAWEAPFNHVVPDHWKLFQSGWDGEPLSPHAHPQDPHRFMAAHMAVIPTGPHRGKLLVLNWMRKHHVQGHQYWSIVDVTSDPPTFLNFELDMPEEDIELFCAGHAWTANGELLVVGGDRFEGERLRANRLAYRFCPEGPTGNGMWRREPDMVHERWYPTVTAMGTDAGGHDLMLVSGGIDFDGAAAHRTYEAFDPSGPPGHGVWQTNHASGDTVFDGPSVACIDAFGIYPRDFLLTSGHKFSAGMGAMSFRVLHPEFGSAAPPLWQAQPMARPLCRWYGSSFVWPAPAGSPLGDVVFRLGGAIVKWDGCSQEPIRPPTASVEFCRAGLDPSAPDWGWETGPPLKYPRNNPSAVVLPDGTVVVLGGRLDAGSMFQTNNPVYETELLVGPPFAWRQLAPAKTRRGYHSTASLLPDGRVILGGGERRALDYEIFKPPYLTDGSARPEIVDAPDTLELDYGRPSRVAIAPLPEGVAPERVVLMAPSSVTHHTDMHQRYVDLEVLAIEAEDDRTWLHFRAPRDAFHAPRGFLMLFVVTESQGPLNQGTPSEATWVRVR